MKATRGEQLAVGMIGRDENTGGFLVAHGSDRN